MYELENISWSWLFLLIILIRFNYKRITIKDKLNIKNEFDKKELVNFTENLINKINDKHELLFIHDSVKPKNIYSFEKNIQISKENTAKLKGVFKESLLKSNYKNISVKKILLSFLKGVPYDNFLVTAKDFAGSLEEVKSTKILKKLSDLFKGHDAKTEILIKNDKVKLLII